MGSDRRKKLVARRSTDWPAGAAAGRVAWRWCGSTRGWMMDLNRSTGAGRRTPSSLANVVRVGKEGGSGVTSEGDVRTARRHGTAGDRSGRRGVATSGLPASAFYACMRTCLHSIPFHSWLRSNLQLRACSVREACNLPMDPWLETNQEHRPPFFGTTMTRTMHISCIYCTQLINTCFALGSSIDCMQCILCMHPY